MPVGKRHLSDSADSFNFVAKKPRLEGCFDFSILNEEVSKLFNEINNNVDNRESSIKSECCNDGGSDGGSDDVNSFKVEDGTVGRRNEMCVTKTEVSKTITFEFVSSIIKHGSFSLVQHYRFTKTETTNSIKHELCNPMNAMERFHEDVHILSSEQNCIRLSMSLIIVDIERFMSSSNNAMKMLTHYPTVDNQINYNNGEVDEKENKSNNKICHTNDDLNNVAENVTNNDLNNLSIASGDDYVCDSYRPYTVEVNGQKVWAFFDTYANDDFEPTEDIAFKSKNYQTVNEVFVMYNNIPVWAYRDVYEISNSDEEEINSENCVLNQYKDDDDELLIQSQTNVEDTDDDFESEIRRLSRCVIGLTETQTDIPSDD